MLSVGTGISPPKTREGSLLLYVFIINLGGGGSERFKGSFRFFVPSFSEGIALTGSGFSAVSHPSLKCWKMKCFIEEEERVQQAHKQEINNSLYLNNAENYFIALVINSTENPFSGTEVICYAICYMHTHNFTFTMCDFTVLQTYVSA